MRNWQRIREWPRWVWAVTGVLAVGIVVAAVFVTGGRGTDTAAPATTTTQPTTTITSTLTTTTTTTPMPRTTTHTPTTTRPTTTAKPPPGHVPGIVIASAGSAGGSGEVQVEWKAVALATGYRVYTTDSAGHHARLTADINIVTGRTRAVTGVSTIWSNGHTYVPYRGALTSTDHSSRFWYVDTITSTSVTRYYRVQAYNAAGAGPLSAVTGGIPVVGPPPSLPAE